MRPEIEQLLVLQDRDQRIKRLRIEQTAIPREQKECADQLQNARLKLEQSTQRLKENTVEKNKLETQVQAKQNDLARFRTQQQQTRKNEEYQALTNEIQHVEKVIVTLEDQELELMEKEQELKKITDLAQKEWKDFEQQANQKISELKSKEATLQSSLKDLETQRAALTETISPEFLNLYQRIFTKKGDAAVVALENDVCSGCHMHVPSQTVVQLKSTQTHELVQCPQCGRILYRD